MHKKTLLVMLFFITAFSTSWAQVAINNTNSAPNNFAMLDVNASQKGILIPRITTADRTTMAGSMGATEEGLTVYDTDTKSFWFWDGATWVAVGSSSMTSDQDWFKEGTTSAPTSINDKMYHMGQVAIGKNTADTQLDIYSASQTTLFQAKLQNPNDVPLRLGASIDLDGTAITTHGKVGVYTTVGGDPGTSSYPVLEGFEAAVIGQAGVNKDQYGIYTYVTGDNAGIHAGLSTYLDGGSTGDRYANYNYISGASSGKNFLFYGYNNNNGDGLHFGNFNLLGGNGNGVQYGNFNRIWNTGTGKHFGTFNEIYTKSASAHVGSLNLLGAKVDPQNPANTLTPVTGDSNGKRIGTINTIVGDGGGLHIATSNTIISTGAGSHIGTSNVLGHDYINNVNTATAGFHIGLLNNLTDTGNADRVGNANFLGLILDPANPTNSTPVAGDGNAKRVGQLNIIGGDGAGKHYGVVNNIISTGNGEHIGASNVIGIDGGGNFVNGGSGNFVGTENILGGIGSGSHYASINHIVSVGDGLHIASNNRVEGSGNGMHVASFNIVQNNGSGVHIAVYGEVEPADVTAMAGVFKGYTTSGNQVSTINLYSAAEYNVTNTAIQDLVFVEAGFDPTLYNKLGMVEVKVVIRVTEANGIGNEFQLRALNNGGTSTTIISTADTWTWTETDTTNNKFIVTSDWKPWNAGTGIWELHLQGKKATSLKFDNVYILVRPAQP